MRQGSRSRPAFAHGRFLEEIRHLLPCREGASSPDDVVGRPPRHFIAAECLRCRIPPAALIPEDLRTMRAMDVAIV